MEGTLEKWTNYLTGWRDRFFVLRHSVLYYYYEKNSQAKGKIFLGLATISHEENELMFEISTGTSIIYIKGHNIEEKNQWIQAIKIGKLEGEMQLKSMNNVLNQSVISSRSTQQAIEKMMLLNKSMKELIQHSQELKVNTDLVSLISQYDKEIQILQTEENIPSLRENESEIREQISIKVKANKKIRDNDRIESFITKEEEVFFYIDDDEDDTAQDKIVTTHNSPPTLDFLKINNNRKIFTDPLYNYQRRTCLPVSRLETNLNVWSIFKNAVGKDVNRFGVPVVFNEPLSMLQRLAENFQYVNLLNRAANESNPYIRLALCACFCIGGFAMNVRRATKYFNPLLFETFEYIDNDQDYRYFAEQVSHHPAISACYAEGKGWDFYTNNNAILKFLITGKLEVNNIGRCYANFSNFNDNIVFTKPLCVVRNLIFGQLLLDMVGKYHTMNGKGDICEIDIIPSTSGVQGNLFGTIKDIYGNVIMKIEGNFCDNIRIIDTKTNKVEELWKIIPSAGYENYYLQPFSFDLNHLTEEMKINLPCTDSRFRPDQRMVEYQEMDQASDEKHRLEEKQRKKRNENQKNGVVVKPMYFDETYDDLTGELIYKYKGTYFTDRQNKNFDHFPDIF